jgi:hypothetical protein
MKPQPAAGSGWLAVRLESSARMSTSRRTPAAVTHRVMGERVRALPARLARWQPISRLRRMPDAAARLWFALGLAIVFVLSGALWPAHWISVNTVLRLVDEEARFRAYGCRYRDCAVCLTEIDTHRDGFVFTGGSGGASGFDLEAIARAGGRPVANCIILGTTLDGFPLVLNQRNQLSSQQVVLHALNTWVFIDGGHFTSLYDGPSPYFLRPDESPQRTATDRWKLYLILLQRDFWNLQVRWRGALRRVSPFLEGWAATLPLDSETHIELKERVMQRWVKISPWAKSFLQRVDVIPSEEAVRERLARVRQRLPGTRIVVFNMPEYTPITQAQREPIYRESKHRFLAALREAGMEYVDIDYEACGIGRGDFWKAGPYFIDPVHPNDPSKATITDCFLTEMRKHGVLR